MTARGCETEKSTSISTKNAERIAALVSYISNIPDTMTNRQEKETVTYIDNETELLKKVLKDEFEQIKSYGERLDLLNFQAEMLQNGGLLNELESVLNASAKKSQNRSYKVGVSQMSVNLKKWAKANFNIE